VSPIEIAWTAVGAVVALLIGTGYTLVGFVPPEFGRARFCFYLSAAIFGGMEIVWYTQTGWPFFGRVTVACLICLTIGVGLPETLRWVHRREVLVTPPAPNAETSTNKSDDESTPKIECNPSVSTTLPAFGEAFDHEPKLRDLFIRDYPTYLKIYGDCTITWRDSRTSLVTRQLYMDHMGKTKFVGYYVPNYGRTFEVGLKLALQTQPTMDFLGKFAKSAGYRDQQNTIDELTFSRRVALYHEESLSTKQKHAIYEAFQSQNTEVQFYGGDYLMDQVISWRRANIKPHPAL
jgi:hypothetical protein